MAWLLLAGGVLVQLAAALAVAARWSGGWRALRDRGFQPAPGGRPLSPLFSGVVAGSVALTIPIDPTEGDAAPSDFLVVGGVAAACALAHRLAARR